MEKFSTDAVAYQYILDKLEESKVVKAPFQSGFEFELTVISSDGSSRYSQIRQLCTDYHFTYGCVFSSEYSSAGFYGYEYYL